MNPLDPIVTSRSLLARQQRPSQLLEEPSQKKFLRFSLGPQGSGLLLLEQVSEVLSVNVAGILPVPEMPSCVLGVYNWRSKMLWLVDLDHLVDYPSLLQAEKKLSSLMAIVIQMNDQAMGLVVQQVYDIELHNSEELQPPAADLSSPRLLPFVKGYLSDANNTVLAPEAIACFPMWQVHRS